MELKKLFSESDHIDTAIESLDELLKNFNHKHLASTIVYLGEQKKIIAQKIAEINILDISVCFEVVCPN